MHTSYDHPASPSPAAGADTTLKPRRRGAQGHPCDDSCGWASSPPAACTCICGGARHGSYRATPAQISAARARVPGRDPFAGMPVSSDEPF